MSVTPDRRRPPPPPPAAMKQAGGLPKVSKMIHLETQSYEEEEEDETSPLSRSHRNESVIHETQFISIEEAKQMTGGDKEKYLNDDDFETVFSMNKKSFYNLAGWKQKQIKKKAGFF